MLTIGKPYLREEGDRVFLCAMLTLGGVQREAWYSVEREYGPYLTDDRCDAFVVGFLTTAMRMGLDIRCEAPVTKRLKYQLNEILIPALAANMTMYHRIRIIAETTTAPLESAGAVGTGWTGGVDCTYTLMTHMDPEEPGVKLTHLVVANNGALECEDKAGMLKFMVDRTRNGVAREYGLKVVGVDTNLYRLQNDHYLAAAAYRLPAVALALQKLFRVFLNSAGPAFSYFKMDQEDSSHYELLPLSNFETDATVFYSAGCKFNRVQKLEALSEFPLAQKNLHPCIYAEKNCSKCFKCTRTMMALYVLGSLENFRDVFDVDLFYQHKDTYLEEILLDPTQSLNSKIILEIRRRNVPIPPAVLRRVRIKQAAKSAAGKIYLP